MKCCNRELKNHKEELVLFDVGTHINRFIRIYDCTHCHRERAVLSFYNQDTGKFEYDMPKAKNTKQFVDAFKKEKYLLNIIINIKVGSKSNMSWVYGKNNIGYDFNGVRQV